MNITINNQTFELKHTLRGLSEFEELTGKYVTEVSPSLKDTVTLFYSFLKVKNKDFEYSLDEFFDILDEHSDLLETFNNYLLGLQKQEASVAKPVAKKKRVNNSK